MAKIMDMTYSEIEYVKSNINNFVEMIAQISKAEDFEFKQCDKEFFVFIAKHIVFLKYLYNGMGRLYFFKVIISDLYYYVLSIIKGEIRYMYLNERSIIENYTRAATHIMVEDDHVTENTFKLIKEKKYPFKFTSDDYALIKDEYRTSCGYIHGGNVLEDNLSFVFDECINNKKIIKNKTNYYMRIINIIKVYDKILISEYSDKVSGCYHRRKSLLKYLIGEECLELLFKLEEKR